MFRSRSAERTFAARLGRVPLRAGLAVGTLLAIPWTIEGVAAELGSTRLDSGTSVTAIGFSLVIPPLIGMGLRGRGLIGYVVGAFLASLVTGLFMEPIALAIDPSIELMRDGALEAFAMVMGFALLWYGLLAGLVGWAVGAAFRHTVSGTSSAAG